MVPALKVFLLSFDLFVPLIKSSKIKYVISSSKRIDLTELAAPESSAYSSSSFCLPCLLSSSSSTLVFSLGICLNASHLHLWACSLPCQQTMLFLYEQHPECCIISCTTVTFSPRMLSSTLDAVSHWSATLCANEENSEFLTSPLLLLHQIFLQWGLECVTLRFLFFS